jgi:hypothetical protein
MTMARAHIGSRLMLKNQIVPVRFDTAHLSFQEDVSGVQYGELFPSSMIAPIYTLRDDGIFGNCIAIEEGTTNTQPDSDFNNTSAIGYYGWSGGGTVYRGLSSAILDNISGTEDLAMLTYPAITTDTGDWMLSMKCRSLSGTNIIVTNYLGFAYHNLGSAPANGEWVVLQVKYSNGQYATNPTQHTKIYAGHKLEIDWIQLENKSFVTSFVNGSRSSSHLTYDISKLGIDPLGDWTISSWFKRHDPPSSWSGLFTLGTYYQLNQSEFQVWTNHNGVFRMYSHDNQAGRVKDLFTPNAGELNEWFFVAITRNKSTNLYNFYVWTKDRVVKDSYVMAHANPIQPILRVGGGDHIFNGLISDFKMDKYEMSQEEVGAIYESKSPMYNPYDTRTYAY